MSKKAGNSKFEASRQYSIEMVQDAREMHVGKDRNTETENFNLGSRLDLNVGPENSTSHSQSAACEGSSSNASKGSSSNKVAGHDVNTSIAHESVSIPQPSKTKPSFASLFRDNRISDEKCLLEYIPFEGDELTLTFDEIDTVENSLGFCLVGCVVGRKLNGYAVRDVVRKWGNNIRFQIHESGWITFFFASEDERQMILKGGPYLVFGRHLYLKEMPRCFLYRVEDMLQLPTWVQVHGLPADCWTYIALSRIASIVGKPIHTDKLTQSKDKSKFARVFVEVDASKPKIHEFSITLPTGHKVMLHFVYEMDPKFCTTCNVLGHSWDTCYRNSDRVIIDPIVEEAKEGTGREEDGREGARSWSQSGNARRRWNRRNNRGGANARGRGLGGGRGDGDVGDPFVVVAEDILATDDGDVDVGVGVGVSVENMDMEAANHVDEDFGFELTPNDGSEKFIVEMFADEVDTDGFEEVNSKRTKKAIRYLKRLRNECNTGNSSSTSTEYVEVDPRNWKPRWNVGTVLMTHAQAAARRHRASLHH